MSALATEKWSGPSLTLGTGQDDAAARLWDVIGASTLAEAIAASGIATINDPYEPGDRRLCRNVTGRQVSIGVYEVTASYAIPPTGAFTPVDSTNPLLDPPLIQWQTVIETLPFDRTVGGHPVLNPASDPWTSPLTRTTAHKILRITKNRRFYDYAQWNVYENTTNNANIVATEPNGHVNTWSPGTVKCVSIEPARAYKANDTFVPIVATLEIYELNGSVKTNHPHQPRALCQGFQGFYDDGGGIKKGPFVRPSVNNTVGGDPVSEPVRLDSVGKPFPISDAAVKVRGGDKMYAPIANPEPIPQQNDWVIEYESQGAAVFVVYAGYYSTDLNAMLAALLSNT